MITDDDIYALICPECHEEALIRPPRNWTPAWGPEPDYSHTDGEPLCPVMTAHGYQPAHPIEPTDHMGE